MAEVSPQHHNGDSNSKDPSRITWESFSVLLDINNRDRLVFARLSAVSTLKIGDKFTLRPLVGCPFSSLFQVETGPEGGDIEDQKSVVQLKDETKDNRALVDNNSAQNLSGQDIESMRRLFSMLT